MQQTEITNIQVHYTINTMMAVKAGPRTFVLATNVITAWLIVRL